MKASKHGIFFRSFSLQSANHFKQLYILRSKKWQILNISYPFAFTDILFHTFNYCIDTFFFL